MKITPQGNGPHIPLSRNGEPSANPAGSPPDRQAITSGTAESIADLVTRMSIVPLVELLNQPHENRAELVARARERLANGEYLTPLAAQQSADAILGLLSDDQFQSPQPPG